MLLVKKKLEVVDDKTGNPTKIMVSALELV